MSIEPDPKFLRACDFVSEGASVRTACEKVGVDDSTFYRALRTSPALRDHYARATDHRADVQFEGLEALLEDVRHGRLGHNEARLIIDTRKWAMAKQRPKKYGDRVETETSSPAKTLTREEALAQLQASGLSVADVFGALTRPADPLPAEPLTIEAEPAADAPPDDAHDS